MPLKLLAANLHLQIPARRAYLAALRAGDIVRADRCEDCGARPSRARLHGHHADYARPLLVTWLCHKCHFGRHVKQGLKKTITPPTHVRFLGKTQTITAWSRELGISRQLICSRLRDGKNGGDLLFAPKCLRYKISASQKIKAKKAQVRAARRVSVEAQKAEISRLRSGGLSWKEIGKVFGFSPQYAQYIHVAELAWAPKSVVAAA